MSKFYCKEKLFFSDSEIKRLTITAYSLLLVLLLSSVSSSFGLNSSEKKQSLPLFTVSFTVSNYNGYEVSCNGASNGSIDMTLNGAVQPVTIIWSNGEVTEDIDSLSAGTYTVTVTDFNGDTTVDSVTLTQPDAIQIFQATITNVTCYGANTGSIGLSIGGGVTPYDFLWSDGELTEDVSALSAGSYSVTITDANSCIFNAGYLIDQPDSISIIFSSSDETCESSNGSISVIASGGIGNLAYLWSNGAGAPTISGLIAGAYTVTVTDDSGCVKVDSFSIINLASPVITIDSVPDVTCFGGSDGAVFISVSGSSIPFSYAWSNTETIEDISNLTAGTYTITVTDNIGCTASLSSSVNQPADILMSFTTSDETCGNANGSVIAGTSGGTGIIDLLWSTGAITSTISNLSAGIYTLTATDSRGCSKTDIVPVVNIAGPLLNLDSIHNVSCNGGNDGAVFISAAGGTAPLNYLWSDTETIEDITNLNSGFYTVTVTDSNNCTATTGANVSQPSVLSATLSKTDATCGNVNGKANVVTIGGTGIVTYLWSTGETTATISNLATGMYTVTATDTNGCFAVDSVSIINIPGPSVSVNLVNDVSCHGGTDGFIDINVNNGTQPFSFIWSNGGLIEDITNLTAGTYIVTVTDFNTCTSSVSVTVTEPPGINLNLTVTNATCGNSNGSVSANASGGTGTIGFEWSTGQTISTINGLSPGTYTVTATDANGCSRVSAQTLTDIPGPTVNVSSFNNVFCNAGNNGSIDIAVTGGTIPLNFAWSNSETTEDITNLVANNYSVIITDSNNCTATITQSITEPAAINLTVTPVNATCGNNNGSANANTSGGTGGINYLWSTGQTTTSISGLSAGAYTVTATDANGCSEVSSTFIQNVSGPSINVITVNHVTCNGGNNGSIDISISGGSQPITYLWSNGFTTEDINNLSSGSYTVTTTDNNSCTSQTNIIINEPTGINVGIVKTDALCGLPVGTATALATGGTGLMTYQWSNGALTPVISLLVAATYTVTATDANNCTASSSVTIVNLNGPVLGVNSIVNVSCNGGNNGAIDINSTGGAGTVTYNWSNGNITQDLVGITANTYTVTATDANNCTAVISATVTEPAIITINVNGTTATCGNSNGTANASANGGIGSFSYVWSNGALTPFVSGLSAGTYTVTATDANNCTKTASVNIANTISPTINISTVTNVSCFNGSNGAIDISVSGGQQPYNFAWSHGATTEDVNSLSAGSYTVSVFDQNNCLGITTVQVTQPSDISVLTSTTNANCNLNNGTATVSATGGTGTISFLWSGGSSNTTITNLASATYTVTATDANFCTKSNIAIVQLTQGLSVSVMGNSDVSCFGGSNGTINITVNGGTIPFTYLWSNGATTEDLFNLPANAYTVTVTDADLCTTTIGEFVSQPSQINVNISSSACHGSLSNGTASCNPSGGVGGYTFLWSNGSTSPMITGLLPGNYTVTVTDANNCQRNGTINVPFVDPCSVSIDSIVNVNCFGESNGSIFITVFNSQGPVNYIWSNSDTNEDIFNLNANVYTVTIQDSAGCIASADTAISQPPLLTTNIHTTNSTCGNLNGEADVTAGGGSPGYTYLWSNLSTNDTISNVAAATYTITVTDSHGCTTQANVNVNNTAGPLIVVDSVHNVLCHNGTNGGIFTTITGGTAPVQIRWNGVLSTSSDSSNLSSGVYTLKVTDANNCVDSVVITITQPSSLTVNVMTTPEACSQGNGTAVAQVNGGTQPYSFQWSSSGLNNDTITGLVAGVVVVTVTDANGCTATNNGSVGNQNGPVVTLDSVKNVSCFGGTNGAVYTTITGGIGPYIIKWNGVVKSNTDTINAVAGNYTILVTDFNGCTAQQSATITQPLTALSVNIITSPESCNQSDGIAIAQVNGGTTPYNFQWSVSMVNNDTINGLNSGPVIVTVTDINGCVATNNGSVGSQGGPILTLDSVKNVSCFGGTNGAVYTTLTGGMGPYVIRWNGVVKSNADTVNAAAGTYIILVTDANGCTAQQSATITQPSAALNVLVLTTPEACGQSNGTAIAQVSGGTASYNYQWSSSVVNNDTITGLSAGTVTVTVTDFNGCVATDNALIGFQNGPLLVIDSINNVSCFGGSDGGIFTSISGGVLPYTIRWNGIIKTNSDSLNAATGSYIILVTDANGCTSTQTAVVTQPLAALTVNVVTNPTACGQSIGSAIAQVNGGTTPYTFQWSAGAVNNDTITALAAGAITVTVTDLNGCSATDNGSVGNLNGPTVVVDSVINVSCSGLSNGAIYSTITGGTLPYIIRWNGFVKSNDDTVNAAAGNYTIFVTDANGCSSSAASAITQPPVLAVNVVTNPTACSQSIGSAIAQVTGGTSPYSFTWSAGAINNDTISGLAAGNYIVTITDDNGCTATDNGTVSNLSAPIVVIDSIKNVICFGAGTGAIYTTISLGTLPYTIRWNGIIKSNADTINALAGAYTILVTDAFGCTSSQSATITQPVAALAVNVITHPTACSQSIGSAIAQVTAGVQPFTFQWSAGAVNNDTINNLPQGVVTVTITDADGCTATDSGVVGVQSAPAITIDSVKNISCNGGSNGAIYTTISGGLPPYIIRWNGIIKPNADTTNAAPGLYTILVTDANGCTASQDTTISQPGIINLNMNSSPCTGGNMNGSATCSATGGSGNYTFLWSNSSTTSLISSILPGTYTVTVTDSNGCSKSASTTVGNIAACSIQVDSVRDVSCFGGNDGAIYITPVGTLLPITYLWSNLFITEDLENVQAGVYTVTLVDLLGCIATATDTIHEPTQLTGIVSTSNSSCGNANGQAVVVPAGGTAGYTYVWSNNSSNDTIFNIFSGPYSVTITDANGCTAQANGTVSNTPGPAITLDTIIPVSCNGGSDGTILTTISGGTPPFQFTWNGISASSSDTTGISAGSYILVVIDSNNCVASDTFTVSQPPILSVSVTTSPANCGQSNGSAFAQVTGGTPPYVTYQWSGGGVNNDTITGIPAGTITVTVTDSHGCTATDSATVTNLNGPQITVDSTKDVSCFGGNDGLILTTITGGTLPYTYKWNGVSASGSDTINAAAGSYTLLVTDSNGCTASQTFIIVQPLSALSVNVITLPSTCGQNNGTAIAQTSGGTSPYVSYQWSASLVNNDTITGLSAGAVTVTVTDSNACTATGSGTVLNQAGPQIIRDSIIQVSCFNGNNGAIYTSITGGTPPLTTSWNGTVTNNPDTTNLSAGTYIIVVTDSNGCSASDTITVTQPSQLTANVITTPTTCGQSNGTAIVQVSGGTQPFTYSWSASAVNNDTITGLPVGWVIVTVTDSNNCSVIDSGLISNLNGPTVTIDSVKDVSCFNGNNGAVYATIFGGTLPYAITWNGVLTTSEDTLGAPAGTYVIVVTDSNGCSATASDTVFQPSQLTVSVNVKHATCGLSNGQAVAIPGGGTPGYTFLWSFNNLVTDTISNLSAGTYTVTVTDMNGCTAQSNGTVVSYNGPSIAIDSVVNVNCFAENNGAIYTSINGGTSPLTFTWNGVLSSSEDTVNLVSGNYVLVVTDSNGCTATDSAFINQPQELLVNILTTPATCGQNNGSAVAQVTGGTPQFNYTWNISPDNNDTISGLAPGFVSVTVTDAHGCVADDGDTIQNFNGPQIILDSLINVNCKGGNTGAIYLTITGGTGSTGILWSNANPGVDNVGVIAGTYTITVTDSVGCIAIDSFTVTEPAIALSDSISVTNATCGSNNGSATVFGIGGVPGYSYLWFDNSISPDHFNLGAGSWAVTVTDSNGCSFTDFAIISNINGPEIIVDSIIPVTCYGGNTGAIYVSVNGTGNFNYQWSDGVNVIASSQDLIGVPAGNYILTVTDINNCISLIDTLVPQNPAINLAFAVTPAQCGIPTGSVTVTPSGGGGGPYTYQWSNAATTQFIINLPANPYTVTVTDNLGCSVDSSTIVTNPGSPLITVVNLVNAKCYGENSGLIDINVSGGTSPYSFTYYLNNVPISFDEDADSLVAGNYFVTVEDSVHCTSTYTFTITQPSQINISFIITPPTCGNSNGSVVATVNGGVPGISGYSYLWSDGSNTNSIFNQPAGIDTLTVTDSIGCSVFQAANISNLGGPEITSVDSTNVTCHGASNGSITIVATGNGLTYSWLPSNLGLPATPAVNNLPGNNYTVIVSDNQGCVTIRQITIYEPPDITYIANIPIHNPPYNLTCNGSGDGSIELINVTGGTPYNGPGVPHYNYLWSPLPSNSPSIFNLSANTYSVTITDSIGCIKNATFILTQPPLITANGGGNLNICGFDSTGLQADTPSYGQGHWILEQGTGTILNPNSPVTSITGLSVGINILGWVVKDSVCTDTSQVIISVNSSIEAIVGVDRAICDPVVVLTATLPQTGSGIWNVVSGNGVIANINSPATAVNGLSQGPNVFQWTVQNGTCVDSARVIITLKDPSECIEPIEMPNGITPNGDGKNDYFFVKGLGDIPNKIEIYNRWGNMVYDKENYDNSWEGKNNSGQDLPDGTYFVILSVPSRAILLKGYVDLRRGANQNN